MTEQKYFEITESPAMPDNFTGHVFTSTLFDTDHGQTEITRARYFQDGKREACSTVTGWRGGRSAVSLMKTYLSWYPVPSKALFVKARAAGLWHSAEDGFPLYVLEYQTI